MAKKDDLNENLKRIRQAMQKPFRPDTSFIDMQNQFNANTAYEMQRVQQELDTQYQEIAERNERRDNAIQRTAQESIEHTRLLEKQLQEVQTQNEMLKTEAAENKAATEEARKDAKKNARKATIANWFAGLSLFVSVASITFTVLNTLKIIPWW